MRIRRFQNRCIGSCSKAILPIDPVVVVNQEEVWAGRNGIAESIIHPNHFTQIIVLDIHRKGDKGRDVVVSDKADQISLEVTF